jgi:catechol 2,3-dioxygenase-like lactoylglutathione lyase family enzyme
MLGGSRVAPTIPVRDPARSRDFYEGALGLKLKQEMTDGGIEYECGGGTSLFTYPTEENAGKSPATLATFEVDDAPATVGELRGKGVTFEEYDMPGMKTEHGVAAMGDTRAAWLKDPDGNILEIVGG